MSGVDHYAFMTGDKLQHLKFDMIVDKAHPVDFYYKTNIGSNQLFLKATK